MFRAIRNTKKIIEAPPADERVILFEYTWTHTKTSTLMYGPLIAFDNRNLLHGACLDSLDKISVKHIFFTIGLESQRNIHLYSTCKQV